MKQLTHRAKLANGAELEIYTHPNAGFIWRNQAGELVNYAIPTDAGWSVARLEKMLASQGYRGAIVESL